MKINWSLLFYIIGFTAILTLLFQWNYDLIRKIFFIWGIISVYTFVLSFGFKKVKKKKVVPSYIR